jgi:NADH-quinone oxidoreductase subunit N
VYAVATLGAFAVLTQVSQAGSERDSDQLADVHGLFWRRPYLAAAFTVMMLSLAGIPFTGGFMGKFVVFSVGMQAQLWLALGIMVAGSVIGVFYYLRVIVTLFRRAEEATPAASVPTTNHWSGDLVVMTLFALALGIGVFPQPIFDLIHLLMG